MPFAGPAGTIGIGVRSLALTAVLRLRGVECSLVTCEDRLPTLHTAGTVRLGRVALRGAVAPVELGAASGGTLEIAGGAFLNQGASVVAAHRITIGAHARIGDFAAILDCDQHPLDEDTPPRVAPVELGENVWIARGALILPGVRIGDHAVVAAGSVVREDVAPGTLVGGIPARPLRQLRTTPGWRRP